MCTYSIKENICNKALPSGSELPEYVAPILRNGGSKSPDRWLKEPRNNHEEIQQLIADKKAAYTVHIECPSTSYRTVLSSNEPEIEFKLNSTMISKVIEIRTFIVLTEAVESFYSEKFHPDYQGQKFDLEAHQIIAIGTAKNYDVKKNDRDFDSLPSILRIVKLEDKKKGTLSVNTNNDNHIVFELSEDVFELYARLGKSTFKASTFSLVLLPTLIVVIQRMCNSKDDESVNSMHWYKIIESLLNNNGYNIEDLSIDNDSLLSVCQSIFADSIARSFKELDAWSERV